MKIARIESLHAAAGTRNFDFLKLTTDTGLVPNLRIMETDPDTVPWHDDLVTVRPAIKDGHMSLPTGPGWGTEVDEETVRTHPPRQR